MNKLNKSNMLHYPLSTLEMIKLNPDAIFITERSLFTDKYIFAKMLYDQGKIEDVNYQIYLN